MLFKFLILTSILTITYAVNKLVTLPVSLTSRLDSNFYRDTKQPFSFTNLTNTNNSGCEPKDLLASQQASFISYTSEFTSIIGFESEPQLIESRETSIPFAHEGGAYIPETNEVWFTANQLPEQNTNVSSVNLTTNKVQLLSIQPPIVTPNGVNYFNGSAYVCSQGNQSTPGAIYAVDPITLVSKLIVNSWFGFRLNSPNDITFSTKIAGKTFMWFTDPPVAYMQGFSTVPQYGSYVFRYDMLTSELRPVVTDLIIPNGIAFDQNETTLYITDTSPDTGIHIVYAYDLNVDVLPINRRVFSVSSFGIPDGIKIDKNNRVWTGEGDGLNVRNRHGTLLGVILGRNLCDNGVISNFALVNNTVIMLAQEKLWRLDLAVNVI